MKASKAEKITTDCLAEETMLVVEEMLSIMAERVRCDNNDMGKSRSEK